MPTNKVLADDDPELLELLKGGGLKADTIKDREQFLRQLRCAIQNCTTVLN